MGRRDIGVPIDAQVSPALVVGEKDDDVGLASNGQRVASTKQGQREKKFSQEKWHHISERQAEGAGNAALHQWFTSN